MYVNFVFNTVHIIDTIIENFNSKLEKIHFLCFFAKKCSDFATRRVSLFIFIRTHKKTRALKVLAFLPFGLLLIICRRTEH